MKKMRVIAVMLITVMLMLTLSSCGNNEKNSVVEIDTSKFFDFNEYKDSEDIPSWEGEQLKLILWSRASDPADSNIGKTSEYDCINKEALRITGVTMDSELSFDNSGSSADARIAKMIATDSYPDIANGIPDPSGLIQKGVLYRLDEYVEKYAPTVYKLFGPNSKTYGDEWNRQMEKYGGVYSISLSGNTTAVKEITKDDGNYDLTDEQLLSVSGVPATEKGSFYVRADILEKIYPEAHTTQELKAIYEKNGKFTREEIFDVPIKSREDFIEFAYKVKDVLAKMGEKESYAMYTHTGADSWPLLTTFSKIMGYNANYFSYWDKETKKIEYTFKQDWFKDVLKIYNQFIRDGVASKEALIDTSTQFNEKLNSGKYGILLSNPPSGGKYKYRRVWVNYGFDTDKFVTFGSNDALIMRISFFNKNINEQQLIQALRYVEFMASDPGQKLTYWGPKSLGLYTEDENGNLRYNDPDLESEMLNNGIELRRKYGLWGTWPPVFGVPASKFAPKIFYTDKLTWGTFWNPGAIEETNSPEIKGTPANIYETTFTTEIEEVKNFWAARQGFEDALQIIFTSTDDKSFETNYKTMIDYAVENGLTDETLKKCNEYYENVLNKDYMDYLK